MTDAPFAAVVYPPRSNSIGFLGAFADELKKSGIRVGGIIQDGTVDADGTPTGINAVDVGTGAKVAINRPTKETRASGACSLDPSGLADASSILRRAVDDNVDLIVVDKFGQEEQKGKGLSDEIMLAITEGIPLLISVPEPALELWQERTGAIGSVLELQNAALEDWWRQNRRTA